MIIAEPIPATITMIIRWSGRPSIPPFLSFLRFFHHAFVVIAGDFYLGAIMGDAYS
jgi:hypothetical protein